MSKITLSHGNGGELTNKLICDIFYSNFNNKYLSQQNDGTNLKELNGQVIVTTDSYVVSPLFFNGGDIGKLSICGTVNDLVVSGAKPLYITCGFIIEEGFEIETLQLIVESMTKQAQFDNVKIVAGDTKVVEKGKCDGIFINTTGIGILQDTFNTNNTIKKGDKIIINSTIANHGICLLTERNILPLNESIKSDCKSLNSIITSLTTKHKFIKNMRDATRGGIATTLKELCNFYNISIDITESTIPINDNVREISQLIGLDPLYIANEGICIFIVESKEADNIINMLKQHPDGLDARIIGEVIDCSSSNLYLTTKFCTKRILDLGTGEMLPRIC